MRIAVVGATGVLGRALVPTLLAKHTVRALVRSPETARRLFGEQVESVECDLLAPRIGERLPDLLAGCDLVIHAATAIPPVANMSKPDAWDADSRVRGAGTAHLLAAALQVGAQAYLQQSICFAYPDMGDAWISEDTPLDPSRTVLIEMERQVRAVPTDRLRWSILRGGAFVGKSTFQDDAIERLRAGRENVPCDGSSFLALIHVEDMASGMLAAAERAPAGSIFNLADEPIRQGDYLDRLAAALGVPKPPRDPDAPCPPSQRASSEAARTALGWKPTRGLMPYADR